jgi:hypothetical protein
LDQIEMKTQKERKKMGRKKHWKKLSLLNEKTFFGTTHNKYKNGSFAPIQVFCSFLYFETLLKIQLNVL